MTTETGNSRSVDVERAATEGQTNPQPIFRLQGSRCGLFAAGCDRRLPPGPAVTLGERVANFYAATQAQARPLVGALPFDPDGDSALYQPRQLQRIPAAPGPDTAAAGHARIVAAEPSADAWRATVTDCMTQLASRKTTAPQLHKVVLARSLHLRTDTPVNPDRIARCLGGDPGATIYVAPLPVASGEPPAWLVGTTPELLISRREDQVVSNPLAGSAPRHADPQADRDAGATLQASAKDRNEHRYVVEAIADTLAPFCRQLHVPAQPSLQATHTMWHLGTRIEGRLKQPAASAAQLAGLLHPTPAVCGTPRREALATIRQLEPVARGFYAGAVGWTNAAGDGDWYVAIRCARVQDCSMRLFAGAGIVADSQPTLEVAETGAKFRAMLDALDIDESNSLQVRE